MNPNKTEGWLTDFEGRTLQKYGTNKICLEIGSYKGKSSVYMAEVSKKLYCIDLFKSDSGGQGQVDSYTTLNEFLNNTKEYNNIISIIGDSAIVNECLSDNYFDLIFVDGLHTYEYVKSDLLLYWNKLKIGGVMCFHDYNSSWKGVVTAVNEYFVAPDEICDSLAVVHKNSNDRIKII